MWLLYFHYKVALLRLVTRRRVQPQRGGVTTGARLSVTKAAEEASVCDLGTDGVAEDPSKGSLPAYEPEIDVMVAEPEVEIAPTAATDTITDNGSDPGSRSIEPQTSNATCRVTASEDDKKSEQIPDGLLASSCPDSNKNNVLPKVPNLLTA